MYARLALKCISETLFDDAADHFLKSTLDPRILICLFPEIRGSIIAPTDTVLIFKGVADQLDSFQSIGDISMHYIAFGWLAQSHVQRHPG